MLQPGKWWLGLPLLAGGVYAASLTLTPRIEADLAQKIAGALSGAAIDAPRVAAAGRDVTVSGVALSQDEKNRALAAAGRQDGLRALIDATQPAPVVRPFLFAMERNERRVTLTGSAPPLGVREKLRAKLQSLALEVADETQVALGAPVGFDAAINGSLPALGRLRQGKLTLADYRLRLEGEVSQPGAARDIEERFAAGLPQGFGGETRFSAPAAEAKP